MPKALFYNVPGHGHINPSLPLVAELVRRGHQLTYFATENYRAAIEATGAAFRPYAAVDDNYFDARGLSGSVPGKVAYELITTAGEILPALLEIARAEQPDYIIFDTMCPWGLLLARILGLPSVASLSLMVLPARGLLNFQAIRDFLPIVFSNFAKSMEANQRSQALGKKYRIAPLWPASLLNNYGDISISYTSPYFQPFASTVNKSIHFVGWTVTNSPSDPAFPFERIQGRRLIYVSLGTVNNDDAAFFKTCIEAFAGADDFVIMTTGNRIRPESFGTLPENIVIRGWVPQTAVLQRASLFISHAGMNSVHDGLYYGVPLLLVPQQAEQMFTARRVVQLGAGLMLRKAEVNAQTVRETAARLLSDTHFRLEAKRIGETFRASGGMTRAADEIEDLLRKHTGGRAPPLG